MAKSKSVTERIEDFAEHQFLKAARSSCTFCVLAGWTVISMATGAVVWPWVKGLF